MPDPRFFQALGPVSLSDLAALTGARLLSGDGEALIRQAAPLNRADATSISFITDRKRSGELAASQAGACFMAEALAGSAPEGCAVLVTAHPQAAWSAAASALHRPLLTEAGEAWVHPSAELESGVIVSPGAVVGEGARIGAGTHLGPGAAVGPGVSIGRNCRIGPRVVLGFAMVGDNVSISAGAVIGEAGFGATAGPTGVVDVPQLGRVIIQDNVTIGANCCIDRGAFDDTVIGENTKIDNLVHIAHNTRIGRNCVMAAFVGISGSVTVGDGVAFGGRAGVADHQTIGDGASVGAGAGVIRDIPPGAIWSGYPAKPVREWLRETAWVTRSAHRKG
ncbi:MAG: UDP-3-O-(3-hydroxymyristoyl)glucosamine N-acyltransferase [Caulobacter sp.]|nr:UDP-3-O-(3-hydroxymyristoyl)glucosamine N-acyltransferase [Caulobacter sp.]